MKNEPESVKKQTELPNPAATFSYEVSRKPKNRHKKLFAPVGVKLTTPSGAKVPPGWRDVWMTTDSRSPVQAIARDSKGRWVYLYSAEHMGTAAADKFVRLRTFVKAYPSLLKRIKRDMKISEDALALYLIAQTGFRIGSDSETQAAATRSSPSPGPGMGTVASRWRAKAGRSSRRARRAPPTDCTGWAESASREPRAPVRASGSIRPTSESS